MGRRHRRLKVPKRHFPRSEMGRDLAGRDLAKTSPGRSGGRHAPAFRLCHPNSPIYRPGWLLGGMRGEPHRMNEHKCTESRLEP